MQRGHDGVKKLNRLTRIARCRHGRQPRHQTHPCRLTKCLECQLNAVRALERIIFAAIPQRNFDQPDNRPHQIGGNANHAGLPSTRGVLVLSFARIQDRLALLLIHRAVGDAVQDTPGILIPLFLHGFRDEHCGRLIPHCRHNALHQLATVSTIDVPSCFRQEI